MSIFSPQFPSQPTPAGATVATTQFPTELAPFIKDILEKAKAQQSDASYQAYTGPQLAQFSDREKAAMDAIMNQASGLAGTDVAQAAPYFTGAKTAVEGLGQQFTGDTAQQYMNPYQQAVVDQAKAKAVEDYESRIAPEIAAQAVASQPFGGSRQAIAEGMARQDLTDKLTEIQERGSADAFNQGRAAFEAQKARELQQGQQFAQLGQTIPQQALKDLAIQQGVGQQERQQEQIGLDLAKGQFMEEREYPSRALQEYSAIVRGFPFQPSTFTTQTQYQAQPSIGQQLLQLGGTGLGAYTAFTGKAPGAIFGAATGGGIADIIHNQMGENAQMQGPPIDPTLYDGPSAPINLDNIRPLLGLPDAAFEEETGMTKQEFQMYDAMPEYGESSEEKAQPFIIPEQPGDRERGFGPNFQYMNQGGLAALPVVYNADANNDQLLRKQQLDKARKEADKKRRGYNPTAARGQTYNYPYSGPYDKYSDDTVKKIKANMDKTQELTNKTLAGPVAENILAEVKKRGLNTTEEPEVIQEEPAPEIDFSQVVPQGDAASGFNNLSNAGNAGNVGNIDTSSLNFLAGSPEYVTSNDITYRGSKPDTVSFDYVDNQMDKLTSYRDRLDKINELQAKLSTPEELAKLREESVTNKNVKLGLAMMKAFGKTPDPSKSLVSTAAEIGGTFAEEVEPSMDAYRKEQKEIDAKPLELLKSMADVEGLSLRAGEPAETRKFQTTVQKAEIEFKNNNALANHFKTLLTTDKANQDNKLKADIANQTIDMNLKKLQGDFLIADAKNKQDNAKLLTTMRKEGMVQPADLKAIKDTALTTVFGPGKFQLDTIDGVDTIVSPEGIPVSKTQQKEYDNLVSDLSGQFAYTKQMELAGLLPSGQSALSEMQKYSKESLNTNKTRFTLGNQSLNGMDFYGLIKQKNPNIDTQLQQYAINNNITHLGINYITTNFLRELVESQPKAFPGVNVAGV
tara:strand:- start:5307 stop:8207 length:2901 start_codon:yes stop_codon:yes gene_type:complete